MVDRPVQCVFLSDARREPEWVLADAISLTSTQAQELFDLLQANESALRAMAEKDAAVAKARMDAAVRLLIGYLLGERHKQEWDVRKDEEDALASDLAVI